MHLLRLARLTLLTLGTTAALGFTVLVANGGLGGSATTASAAAQEPRELIVLAGVGQDTVAAFAYFPDTCGSERATW